nr:carboxypeptidase M32 [Asgard group archaeon]
MGKIVKEIDLYQKLLAYYKELTIMGNISSVLHWDKEVMMPSKGVYQRAECLALLSGMIHEKSSSPKIGSLLQEIQSHTNFDSLSIVEKRNVELIQRSYDKITKIPKSYSEEFSRLSAIATEKWKEAKRKQDYAVFRDDLEKMFELQTKYAHYLNPEKDPYDVLLDNYEKGFSKEVYDRIFTEIKSGLIPLINSCVNSANQPDESIILRNCPVNVQEVIVEDLAEIVKYNMNGGRIDVAVHPFTNGYYDDVRITVSYDPNDFTSSFYAAMHECGHALYEQNFAPEYKYQPIGNSPSSAMHEGQARFIENIIGRSPEFWKYYFPRFKHLTGQIFDNVDFNSFVFAINRVQPSKIRIHADPLTYSLHIILRYELEKEYFAGKLTIDELPSYWNDKMKEYLNIDVENDSEGVLQDTHYAWGYIGYFPTYSLGSYYNAQLLTRMDKDVPNWKEQMSQGKLDSILNWLNITVRNKGNIMDPLDM